jgi:two-component system, LytTR family, sensor kinase
VKRLAVLGAWTVIGLLYTFEGAYAWARAGTPAPLWQSALYQIPSWWVWAIATGPIVRLTRAYPPRPRTLALHTLAWLATATGFAAMRALLAIWAQPGGVTASFGDRVVNQLAQWFPASALAYVAVVGIAIAIDRARAIRQREVRAAQLTAELTRTQLEALRAQIHPHFVFNALHTVAAIVRECEPEKAIEVLVSLAEIMRDTFRGDPDREVIVREELAWISRYLAIQQARFAGRVEVSWTIADGTLDALVPQMVLQPLVENAFRHGLARRGGAGRVELAVERDADVLTLSVRDDGPELDDASADSSVDSCHVGLASTRARLALLYADAAELSVSRDAGSTVARVRLPFHVAP